MSPASNLPGDATVAVSGLLRNSSRELSRIGDELDELQRMLSPFLAASSHTDLSARNAGLQNLDSVTQHVRALSDLFAKIGSSDTGDAGVAKAVGQIPLSTLAARMACGDSPEDPANTSSSIVIF